MGGRGSSGGVNTKGTGSGKALKPGEVGKEIGTAKNTSSLENFMKDKFDVLNQLDRAKKDAFNPNNISIEKETEKANLISWKYDAPNGETYTAKQWVPKSVMPKNEPIYDKVGQFSVGQKVDSGKWGGTISKITKTHTYVKTKNGNELKINNNNMETYFGKK